MFKTFREHLNEISVPKIASNINEKWKIDLDLEVSKMVVSDYKYDFFQTLTLGGIKKDYTKRVYKELSPTNLGVTFYVNFTKPKSEREVRDFILENIYNDAGYSIKSINILNIVEDI